MSKKPGISIDDLAVRHSEEAQELRNQLEEKDQLLTSYRKDHGKLEVFFRNILDAIEPLKPISRVYDPVAKSKLVDTPVVAVARSSDGHCGMVQPAMEIEGFGEYNYQICHDRQIDYIHQFLKWIGVQRQGYSINECSFICTGDHISGDLHELPQTNEFPAPVQVLRAGDIMAEQLAILAPHFEKVTVEFITADNHARLTKKPQSKEEGLNSLNYLVGHIAKGRVEKYDNIEFNIYPFHEKVVHVSSRNYLINHGHGIVQTLGTPWYGIERRIGRESTARLQQIMAQQEEEIYLKAKEIGFHKLVMGHYHVFFEHMIYSCCPSVSGTDAFDHKNGRHSPPGQSAWLVHEKHGEFNWINFLL